MHRQKRDSLIDALSLSLAHSYLTHRGHIRLRLCGNLLCLFARFPPHLDTHRKLKCIWVWRCIIQYLFYAYSLEILKSVSRSDLELRLCETWWEKSPPMKQDGKSYVKIIKEDLGGYNIFLSEWIHLEFTHIKLVSKNSQADYLKSSWQAEMKAFCWIVKLVYQLPARCAEVF